MASWSFGSVGSVSGVWSSGGASLRASFFSCFRARFSNERVHGRASRASSEPLIAPPWSSLSFPRRWDGRSGSPSRSSVAPSRGGAIDPDLLVVREVVETTQRSFERDRVAVRPQRRARASPGVPWQRSDRTSVRRDQERPLERDRVGGPASATYGSSAISRARLTATAICR